MKRTLLIISVIGLIILSVGLSQDIINETGKEGKFIVRDNEQTEVLIIDKGNVDIQGTLSIEELEAGDTEDRVIVWDEDDRKFKALYNMISRSKINASTMAADSWTEDGSGNIYRATGYVGIGTATPAFPLDIQPSVSGAAQLMRESDGSNYAINLKSLSNRGEILIYKEGLPTTKLAGFGNSYFNGGDVGIGTTSPEGRLDIVSTKGALIVPRMSTTQRNNLPTVNGSIIYNITTDEFNFHEDGSWITK